MNFRFTKRHEDGADVILLIAAMLSDKDLQNLYRLAEEI